MSLTIKVMQSVQKLLTSGAEVSGLNVANVKLFAEMMVDSLGSVGCKTALRLMERAVMGSDGSSDLEKVQENALRGILEDLAVDEAAHDSVCEVDYP